MRSYLPIVSRTWLAVARPADEGGWHLSKSSKALAVNDRVACRVDYMGTAAFCSQPRPATTSPACAQYTEHSSASPQMHAGCLHNPHRSKAPAPVATLVHVAVLVDVPPAQLLLQSPQLPSTQWTGRVQLVVLRTHKVRVFVDSRAALRDVLLLVLLPSVP